MREWMKSIRPKAIIIGCLVDCLGTFVFSLVFGIIAELKAAARGIGPEQTRMLLEQWSASRPGMAFLLFFGLGFTFLGGYVATRAAKTNNLVNSAFVGSMAILTGLFFISSTPMLAAIVSIVLSIPVAVFGGFCHLRKWDLF
jgi:hypothetical protein